MVAVDMERNNNSNGEIKSNRIITVAAVRTCRYRSRGLFYVRRRELAFQMNGTRPTSLRSAPHTAVYTYVTSTNVCPAFTTALLFWRKAAPPPPSPHFQRCGLGFVYLDHRQFEHDRILKVFQRPPSPQRPYPSLSPDSSCHPLQGSCYFICACRQIFGLN